MDDLLRVCERCDASNELALRHDNKGNEGTYFFALGDVACWKGGRCLYFLDVIAFGCELLAKIFYRLQACAFANDLLFLDALRSLSYN